ncbi:MAG: AAA family ATPase, partial [Bacteroidales bacterium]|nr:AAA family ATPase [Bacteroidales bacterium]
TVDFKNTILIMTSNLSEEALKDSMRPEFLNRIDEIITFEQLSREDIKEILRIQETILARKLDENGIRIVFTDDFDDYMSDKGYDPAYGARPIKRVIQRELVNLLAKALLDGSVKRDSDIKVDVKDGQIVLS